MSLTYKELYQKVLLRLNESDGRAVMAAKEGVNGAQRYMAMAFDFDELITNDITNAFTVVNQKVYHLEDNLGLTRPKDIYSIRYMDEDNSRKLVYVPPRTVDEYDPYPEGAGTSRPEMYTRRGVYIELIPVPDAAKALYILYSQWPLELSGEDDTSSYDDAMEDVIVALGTDIARSILSGGAMGNWVQRAREILGVARNEEESKADNFFVARPFSSQKPVYGEYWKNPFVRHNP